MPVPFVNAGAAMSIRPRQSPTGSLCLGSPSAEPKTRHLSSCLRSQFRTTTFNTVKKRLREGLAGMCARTTRKAISYQMKNLIKKGD